MTRRKVWLASSAIMVTIVMVMLMAALPGLSASDKPGAGAPPSAGGSAEVKIDNFSYVPPTITVPLGATVNWINRDDIPHTAVSTDGVFKSKVMDTDESFSFTFTKPGTYNYYCTIHPKMTGKVVVQ